MSFEVSFERGAGRSLEPRIPVKETKGKSQPAPASRSTPVKQRKAAVATKGDYWATLKAIEASVSNPPPCDGGTNSEGMSWLEQNSVQSDVVTLPSGMQYKVLAKGREAKKSPKVHTPCLCHYQGFLVDGTEFDSSYARGQPFEFVPADMIQGWTVAMQLMSEGDTWELYVPASMAYGDAGRSSKKRGQYIPANACLVFVLTLVQIKGPARPQPKRPPPGAATDAATAAAVAEAAADAAARAAGANGSPIQPFEEQQPEATAGPASGCTESSTLLPEPPPAAPLSPIAPSGGGGWLGGLFERPTLAEQSKAREASDAASTQPASGGVEPLDSHCAAKLAEQRASIEQSALETVEEVLAQLRLLTLKQALTDLGMPVDGGKEALTQRLTQRLTLSFRSGGVV